MSPARSKAVKRRGTAQDSAEFDSADVLARMVEASGKTRYAFAKAAAMDPAALYRYLDPEGPKMTTSTLQRVAQANGFRLVVKIER